MSKKIPSVASHGTGNVPAGSACYLRPWCGAAMQFLMHQGLVSKDCAVLKLCRRCAPLFRVMTPAEAVRQLCRLPTPRHENPPNLR